MAYSKERLKEDMLKLGIKNGDVILMHSSYKSLGKIDGGAKTFYDALLEVLGKDGTLIVPALSYETVTRDNPVFNLKTSPSCVGYLTEYFRTEVDGVVRSVHPTHSCCAVGKLAKEITASHYLDVTPVGENSPFHKLPEYGGKILMLGCDTRRNTSLHGVEETMEPPYCIDRVNKVTYTITDDSKTYTQTAFRHYFVVPGSDEHYVQRYDRIIGLLDDSEVSSGKILEADCFLMDAKAVWKKGYDKLSEDPFWFVDEP